MTNFIEEYYYRLKKGIKPDVLLKYGFIKTIYNSYKRDIKGYTAYINYEPLINSFSFVSKLYNDLYCDFKPDFIEDLIKANIIDKVEEINNE